MYKIEKMNIKDYKGYNAFVIRHRTGGEHIACEEKNILIMAVCLCVAVILIREHTLSEPSPKIFPPPLKTPDIFSTQSTGAIQNAALAA